MIDRQILNAQRDLASAEVTRIGEEFSRGFANVEMPQPPSIPRAFASMPRDTTKVTVLDNYETKGRGETAADAIREWRADLGRVPPEGRFLHWRCMPEADWFYDHRTEKPIWCVYARFSAK